MLEYIVYLALNAKALLRPLLVLVTLYFLYVVAWDVVYIEKRMGWPAVEARLDHRQVSYRYHPFRSPGSRGGSGRGLHFIEEVFYIPSRKTGATAADFGYLSPRKAAENAIRREKELPAGSSTRVRINPKSPAEATTWVTFGPAFKATGLWYLLGALASGLGIWLLGLG